MTTTAPDTTTLHDLDWQPACETRNCQYGNPAATYAFIPQKCPCHPALICDGCADYWRDQLHDRRVRRLECATCHTVAKCRMGDWFRLEPLP